MQIVEGKEQEYKEYVETNSKDGYSKGVVDYTEAWAGVMETKLEAGEQLEDIWETSQKEIDDNLRGITGFMFGCVMQALAHFWPHGKQLAHLHNAQYLEGEKLAEADVKGGVVNPAIITIGG